MDEKQTEKSIAQTEVVLAALREPALKLLQEGVASSYTSTAQRTENGLLVQTKDNKTQVPSMMIVDGQTSSEHRLLSLDVHMEGNYNITHIQGKKTWSEKSTFDLKSSDWDAWTGRKDQFTVSIKRTDASNNAVRQEYLPAISAEQKQLDPNGFPVRLARYSDGANHQAENLGNPGNRRLESIYIVRDAKGSELSYNETREQTAAGWAYRSVVRDMKGNVLGIVSQSYNLNDKGDLVSVETSARKPMKK